MIEILSGELTYVWVVNFKHNIIGAEENIYFLTENEALEYASISNKDCTRTVSAKQTFKQDTANKANYYLINKISIHDDVEIRKQALAKLTDKEKKVLGL